MSLLHIYLLLLGAAYCRATLTVDVELISYNNPTHEDCDGGHCESSPTAMCDNKFDFCVRAAGNDSCLTPVLRTIDLDSDTITFSPSELSVLGISNPIQFSSINTTGPLEVFVDVTDDDGNPTFDDEVDEIIIPLGAHLQANGEFGPNVTYYGECGRAHIQVRTRITSECPVSLYGPECSIWCEEVPGERVCSYLGEATCLGNFEPPACGECRVGFYDPGCERFCEPQDSSTSGHYTCDESGYLVCLPGYTDNSTNCLTCDGNFIEPDCRECDVNYHPQGTCDTFCEPRDDAAGHYTCSDLGETVCLDGYIDTSSNCTTCRGNFKEPDCNECDDNFEGLECVFCKENYYPKNSCSILCVPRNDSEGHYTCDPYSGSRVCLEGYKDPTNNCVTPVKSESSRIVGSIGFWVVLALGGLFVTTAVVCVVCVASFGRQRRSKYYSAGRGPDTQPIVAMEELPQPTDEAETKE